MDPGSARLGLVNRPDPLAERTSVVISRPSSDVPGTDVQLITSDSTTGEHGATGSGELPVTYRQAVYRSAPAVAATTTTTTTDEITHSYRPVPNRDASPSPQITYKPRHTPPRTVFRAGSRELPHSPHLGAVARLAIEGGLTKEQLLRIGHVPIDSAISDPVGHVPPGSTNQPVVSHQSGRLSRGHATTLLTHCIGRPTHQPVQHCTTYQPIYLSHRATGQPDVWRRPHQTVSRATLAPVGWHQSTPRRGSFPLQMTRVGGLVLRPPPTSSPDRNSCSQPVPQFLSACTSPSSVTHTDQAANPFYFSSSTSQPSSPSPGPLSPAQSSSEIVRLGPGNTVTHAMPTETVFTAKALIRMHDCPQPYVLMPSSGLTPAPPVSQPDGNNAATHPLSAAAIANANEPVPIRQSSPHPHEVEWLFFSPLWQSSSPDENSPSFFTSPPLSHGSGTKSGRFFSPPATQVARTVRHLRRIRHILGDSIGCPTTVSSASAGSLVHCDRQSAISSNSLIELRTHETRSVDSVRPASYTCKCPVSGGVDGAFGLTASSKHRPFNTGLVRFEIPTDERWTPWQPYYIKLLDDTLVLGRVAPEQPTGEEHPTLDHLSHFHIPLASDHLSWHRPESQCLDWEQVIPASASHGSASRYYVLLALRPPPAETLGCHVLIDKPTAIRLLGNSEFAPESWDSVVSKVSSTPAEGTHKPRPRDKSANGRSLSLGVAGPPGGLPLFRAASTAAASIGMSLMERAHMSPLIRSLRDPLTHQSSAPEPLQDTPADSVNGAVKTSPKFESELHSHVRSHSPDRSTSEHRYKRARPTGPSGRLHQAFNRVCRAATASSEATARSFSSAAAATSRRFASAHGLFTHSKSIAITSPIVTAASSVMFEPSSVSSPCLPAPDAPPPVLPPPPQQQQKQQQSSPALLASSVSPNVALRTPCLTYLSADYMIDGSAPDASSSAQTTTSATEGQSELGVPDVATSAQLATITSSAASSFVPLPAPLSGPLPLHKCPRSTVSPFVPFVVELCVTLVERFGLNCVGLYRLSGSKMAHDFISTELCKVLSDIDMQSDKWTDIHAVCGVLKTFLRNLPDSLFPKVMYEDFLTACRIPQREKRLLSIQRLLSIMECYPHHPEYRAHRATLRYLATHLARVSARETVNKMTTYNLALVFAPNLVQPCEDSPELLMTDSKYKIMLVETVIKYHAWIFSPDLGLESGCSVPSDSVDDLVAALTMATVEPEPGPAHLVASNSVESDDLTAEGDRLDGEIQLLVCELFRAAADLPPPPSDTDLETAEEPGPSSDRPSDITVPYSRPRFTSIPASSWSAVALRDLATSREEFKFRPELIFTPETDVDAISDPGQDEDHPMESEPIGSSPLHRPRVFPAHLGTKLDNLRHLSQGCLEHYVSEARQLGVKMAETRRQLELSVAKRVQAEQMLHEARARAQLDEQLTPSAATATVASDQAPSEEHEADLVLSGQPSYFSKVSEGGDPKPLD